MHFSKIYKTSFFNNIYYSIYFNNKIYSSYLLNKFKIRNSFYNKVMKN